MPLDRWAIIDSTLREGEQFANAHFTTEQKIERWYDVDVHRGETVTVPRMRM